MARAYSYLRMSTESQLKGDSKRRQLDLSRRYAAEHSLQLATEDQYEDIGVSAFQGVNATAGELGRFLRAAEDGRIERGSYLLIESLDRLSRNEVFSALSLFMSIVERGIVLVTLSDGFIYSEQTFRDQAGIGQLMYSLTVMSRAHEESLTKSKRLSEAWKNKRQNAETAKLTSRAPAWLRLSTDRKSFEVIEERVALLRRLYEDCKNGIGVIATTRRLNSQSIPSWGGKNGWGPAYVQKLLSTRAVLGEFTPCKYVKGKPKPLEPVQNYFPRVIEDHLFYAAQSARASRKHRGGRRGSAFTNLFTTIVRCWYCGQRVQYVNKGGQRYGTYLRCESAIRAHGCEATAWRYEQFETNFLALVREVNLAEIVADNTHQQQLTELTSKRDTALAKAKEAEASQARLLTALEGETAEAPAVIVNRIRDLTTLVEAKRKEAEQLNEQIRMLGAVETTPSERQEQIRQLQAQIAAAAEADRFALRARLAQLIREVVDRIDLLPDGNKATPRTDAALQEGLAAAGYTPERIAAFLQERSAKSQRAYVVHFRAGQYRYVMPDDSDPAKYLMMATSAKGLQRQA